MTRHTFQSCEAEFDGRTLRLSNLHVERRWRVEGGLLYAESFLDKGGRHEWITRSSRVPAPYPPAMLDAPVLIERIEMRDGVERLNESSALIVTISASAGVARLTCLFKLFPEARGVSVRMGFDGSEPTAAGSAAPRVASPTGLEDASRSTLSGPILDTIDCFDIDPLHVALTEVTLLDGTDVHDNLVFERTWLLSPAEPLLRATGNVCFLENRLTGRGLLVVKFAPLPHARPRKTGDDVRMLGPTFHVLGGTEYETAVLSYDGGRFGRIAAVQQFQRMLRVPDPSRDGRLLSNTWGDRSKDARICEPFMMQEIAAAQRLGVEVVQIDDGWQRGASGNSVTPGGTWTGFWARDPNFWDPHPARFPNGVAPLARETSSRGMKLGLWFAPDSSDDFANWQRDADAVLALHRAHGIEHFKIDGVKMYTPAGERNLSRFVDAVLEGSGGKVVFDLDVTAAVRPGYLGLIRAGNVFVENRYTDWRRYYPHATLRNLWQLAQYVDPVRLRMEFLNHTRNARVYGDDPLAPANYSPEYLFASVMIGAPLGWFEVSNLPADYVSRVAPLVEGWKRHRKELHSGTIVPIGEVPDGTSWTGFASVRPDGTGQILVFRELNDRATATIEVPFPETINAVATLFGVGQAELSGGRLTVRLPGPRQFLWLKIDASQNPH